MGGSRPSGLLVCLLFSSVFLVVSGSHGCCWGDNEVEHGDLTLTLPHCCSKLHCHNGLITTTHIGDFGDINCCEFDDEVYPDGAILEGHCVALQCSQGNWTVTNSVDECCAHGHVYDDPHFTTFDGHNYDFHKTCNYSLAQTDTTQIPYSAVYADFRPCYGTASCVHLATFRENPNTIVALGPGAFDVVVNGEPSVAPLTGVEQLSSSSGFHPILLWRQDDCLHLLGASQIMVVFCEHQMSVWVHPGYANTLDGLCGHFNFDPVDDFTSRGGQVTPLTTWPLAFPESWKTDDQTDLSCKQACVICPPETTSPCRASFLTQQKHLTICRQALHPVIGKDTLLAPHVENCAFDLCMQDQSGATKEEQKKWLIILIIIIYVPKKDIARVEDEWVPSPPPSSGVCTPDSVWMKGCNDCSCINLDKACSNKHCDEDYHPALGESVCTDGSWWLKDTCNWCQCVRGGVICTLIDCNPPTPAPVDPSICQLPVSPGQCYQSILRWYYDTITQTCTPFVYTGCGENANHFLTKDYCQAHCENPTAVPGKPAHCLLGVKAGPCYGYLPRYYYDPEGDSCQHFIFGGCEGNHNNFHTKEDCLKECGDNFTSTTPTPTPPASSRCLLDLDEGSCDNVTIRYYYHSASGQCSAFVFGGCDGNYNNFHTKLECEQTCVNLVTIIYPTPTQSVTPVPTQHAQCLLPAKIGTCTQFVPRYYYDYITRQCQYFVYSGCGGNANNFYTKDECIHTCSLPEPTLPDNCLDEFDAGDGTCNSQLLRYYYHPVSQSCFSFYFTGCGGSGNNFDTLEDCIRTCTLPPVSPTSTLAPTTPPFCLHRTNPGPCTLYTERYYYDYITRSCHSFYGCSGSLNNFGTVEECLRTCNPFSPTVTPAPPSVAPRCQLFFDPGPCNHTDIRYYYNTVEGVCRPFLYGGCGGNYNNFVSVEECRGYCQPVQVQLPECLEPIDSGVCHEYSIRFAYNTTSKQCQTFTYGGCPGNSNNFKSHLSCRKACHAEPFCPMPNCPLGCPLSQPDPTLCAVCDCQCPDVDCPDTCTTSLDGACPTCVCPCSTTVACPTDCPVVNQTNQVTNCTECVCESVPPCLSKVIDPCPSICTVIYGIFLDNTNCQSCICDSTTFTDQLCESFNSVCPESCPVTNGYYLKVLPECVECHCCDAQSCPNCPSESIRNETNPITGCVECKCD